MKTTHLSDDQLLARVKRRCLANARHLAVIIVDLIDIEDRRMHLRAACSSLQEFCKRHLHMSPSEAWRRATAAHLVRRIPSLLDYVRRGEVDLSTLVLLRHFIDEDNAAELIQATRCKSKRQIERYLESQEPRTDRGKRGRELASRRAGKSVPERIEQLSDDVHLLEAAIRNETRVLIERARFLLGDAMPNASLADLVHRAFQNLVDGLEAAVADARTKRAEYRPPVKAGYIPRALRYAVFARDGFQCTYVSANGERCRATRYLEVDHITPRAKGGTDDLDNLRCACSAHNHHSAELAFGKAFVQSRIRTRRNRAPANPRWSSARG